MDVFEVFRKRYSVRGYRPDAVEPDKLVKVLEAARQAPTAANRQPFRVLVVHTQGREEELARVYGRRWFTQAPLVIGFVAVPQEAWRRVDDKPYDEVDATIAMDHLVLAATALGLGTCWVAAFDPGVLGNALGLKEAERVYAITPLGYPRPGWVNPRTKSRKSLEEIVEFR